MRSRPTLPALFVVAVAMGSCLLASGCVENAIFTLVLDLPPAGTGGVQYVVVEGRTSAAPPDFTSDWQQWQASGIVLDGDGLTRTMASVDFVGSSDIETDILGVKIRFCIDERCQYLDPGGVDDVDAPQVNVELERVFYIGDYTRYPLPIGVIPARASAPSLLTVEKCRVQGPDCRAGNPATWCTSSTPVQHFCEVN